MRDGAPPDQHCTVMQDRTQPSTSEKPRVARSVRRLLISTECQIRDEYNVNRLGTPSDPIGQCGGAVITHGNTRADITF